MHRRSTGEGSNQDLSGFERRPQSVANKYPDHCANWRIFFLYLFINFVSCTAALSSRLQPAEGRAETVTSFFIKCPSGGDVRKNPHPAPKPRHFFQKWGLSSTEIQRSFFQRLHGVTYRITRAIKHNTADYEPPALPLGQNLLTFLLLCKYTCSILYQWY